MFYKVVLHMDFSFLLIFFMLFIFSEYFAKLKSASADFKNSVGKPGAGASVAANFLEAFIEEGTEWIHLDIAGTADNNGTAATGAMVRTVVKMFDL